MRYRVLAENIKNLYGIETLLEFARKISENILHK